jgi:hypothetical protein
MKNKGLIFIKSYKNNNNKYKIDFYIYFGKLIIYDYGQKTSNIYL